MQVSRSAFGRDANHVPITRFGCVNTKSATLSANNTTTSVALFNVVGQVEVISLYGIVTTALSSNITAAHWRLADDGATTAISLATGTALSSLPAGSVILRRSLVSVALASASSAAAAVLDPVAATAMDMSMAFIAIQKTGNVTSQIEFRYTTTNAPASGEIMFYCGWIPLTETSYIENA